MSACGLAHACCAAPSSTSNLSSTSSHLAHLVQSPTLYDSCNSKTCILPQLVSASPLTTPKPQSIPALLFLEVSHTVLASYCTRLILYSYSSRASKLVRVEAGRRSTSSILIFILSNSLTLLRILPRSLTNPSSPNPYSSFPDCQLPLAAPALDQRMPAYVAHTSADAASGHVSLRRLTIYSSLSQLPDSSLFHTRLTRLDACLSQVAEI